MASSSYLLDQVQGDNNPYVQFEIPKQSWIIGSSDGSTQSSLERAGFTPFTRRTCQNPQFGMTVNNLPSEPLALLPSKKIPMLTKKSG